MAINAISEEYREYLNSERWQRIRAAVLERDEWRCRVCGSGDQLQIHHTRGVARFHETDYPEYVMTLCDNCHATIHRYFKQCDLLKEHYEMKRREMQK